MIPPPVQSALPLTPVAYFTIDGLGICCFNRSKKTWEVAFLRNGHDFRVVVYEEELSGRILSKETIVVDGLNEALGLEVDNGSNAHYSKYPDGAFVLPEFSRLGAESNDFGWAIDFLGPLLPHGKFVRLIGKNEPGRVPVTLARIPCSLFYTDGVSQEAVIIAPDDGSDPNTGAGTLIGRSSEEIGAVVLADPPGRLRLFWPGGEIKMPYVQGQVYHVSLTNMDVGKLSRQVATREKIYAAGDLNLYYNVIEVDGKHQQLWARERLAAIRARAGDCHPVSISLDTLEPLIQ